MNIQLIGPFQQILTMNNLPLKGALRDDMLEVIEHGAVVIVQGHFLEVGAYTALKEKYADANHISVPEGSICLPGFIDCHTHIAFDGQRAGDFALRNAGSSYLEIAEKGGGIWSTVQHTRACSLDRLKTLTLQRVSSLLRQGITTIEVKSGYGLSVEQELKILRAIVQAKEQTPVDIISTCLAAHMKPLDFKGSNSEYLKDMMENLFPILLAEKLTQRIDAFIEKSAFSQLEIVPYFRKAVDLGFQLTVHADQFSSSGSRVAVEFEALSADHLEMSTAQDIQLLASSQTVAVALPAASLGLGCGFTPARSLLDAGASLAIASDWNPGSAPMGNLVGSASILATMQKLSNAEVFAAITYRAAQALNLQDRGRIAAGQLADFNIYTTANYQNITYLQGSLQPAVVYKAGRVAYTNL